MTLTMEAIAESSKHMRHERINSSGETVGTEQLKRKGECGNATSPFMIQGVTDFGDSWGEEQGTIAVRMDAPVLGRESGSLFQWIPA